jgi:hypothetical protein
VNIPEIVGLAIVALLIYLIASHKIDLAKLRGEIIAEFAKVHATAAVTQAAALAPVSVVNAPPPAPAAPVAIPAPTPATSPASPQPPPGSPAANMSPVIMNMLGGTPQPVMAIPVVDEASLEAASAADRHAREESDTFDLSTPNSPRIFRTAPGGGVAVKTFTASSNGVALLRTAETTGNWVDQVNLRVTDPAGNAMLAGKFSIRSDNDIPVQAGGIYTVAAATDPSLAVSGNATLAMAASLSMKG